MGNKLPNFIKVGRECVILDPSCLQHTFCSVMQYVAYNSHSNFFPDKRGLILL